MDIEEEKSREEHKEEEESVYYEVTDAEIYINGEPKYYTTGQVAKILGENESTIRFWCDEFDHFLNIRRSGRNRQFTATDIKKLEYIRYLLRQENFTIKQVKEFLSTKEAALMQPIHKEREQFIINALSQVIVSEIAQRFTTLEDNIVQKLLEEIKPHLALPSRSEEKPEYIEEIKQQNQQLLKKIETLEEKINEREAQFIAFIEYFRSREKPKSFLEKLKALFFGK